MLGERAQTAAAYGFGAIVGYEEDWDVGRGGGDAVACWAESGDFELLRSAEGGGVGVGIFEAFDGDCAHGEENDVYQECGMSMRCSEKRESADGCVGFRSSFWGAMYHVYIVRSHVYDCMEDRRITTFLRAFVTRDHILPVPCDRIELTNSPPIILTRVVSQPLQDYGTSGE